jgi:N-acetylmuramic acid 6-phosphate etherase
MSTTESPSSDHPDLDRYDATRLVQALIADQSRAAGAVAAASADIVRAVDAAVPRMQAGGRLIYAGAGTSGRLGLLDSVELNPTFSWPHERAIALLAGGETAVYRAVEGAEDNAERGADDVARVGAGPHDVVIVLAASGTTPYALGAIAGARAKGALTVGIANNRDTPVAATADIGIVLDTGAEVISGSTRLKAGTAQKIALNTFSSALMVRLGKVYGNLMVDVRATNAKLINRARRLTMLAAGCDDATARAALERSDNQVKTAIVAIRRSVSAGQARELIESAGGSVRKALGEA